MLPGSIAAMRLLRVLASILGGVGSAAESFGRIVEP
jgi:hypothetical protein